MHQHGHTSYQVLDMLHYMLDNLVSIICKAIDVFTYLINTLWVKCPSNDVTWTPCISYYINKEKYKDAIKMQVRVTKVKCEEYLILNSRVM